MRARLTLSALVVAVGVLGHVEAAFAANSQPKCQPLAGTDEDNRRATAGKKRTALLIGNQKYNEEINGQAGSLPVLITPQQDVKDVGHALLRLGFRVQVCNDLRQLEMLQAVSDFASLVNTEKNDVSLFYYAGHGGMLNNEAVLYGVDHDSRSTAHTTRQTVVRLEQDVIQHLNPAQSGRPDGAAVVIVDACREPTPRGAVLVGRPGVPAVKSPRGTYIAYSTAPGSPASDTTFDSIHSPFAEPLYKALQAELGKTPPTEVDDLFRAVREKVAKSTEDRQVPWSAHSLIGDVTFSG